jgi:predicted DNA-binding protein
MANPLNSVSLRISPELHRRLLAAAERMKFPKHSLCQAAIEAVVVAIEKDRGLVLPIRFVPERVPTKSRKSR